MVEEGSWIMAISYSLEEETRPLIQYQVIPLSSKSLEEAKHLLKYQNLPLLIDF